MKKIIIAILVVSAIGVSSCKKENEVAKASTVKVSDKSNLGTWD